MNALAVMSALLWTIICFLPWRPWSTREVLDPDRCGSAGDQSNITAIIPARDESEAVARELTLTNLEILTSQPLPAGWSGKLWALEQGRARASTALILLLDADIELAPNVLTAAKIKLYSKDLDLVSLLAAPRMVGFWEKLLMPAFIYFFKLLYPFHVSNSRRLRVVAAAGGFVLLKADMLAAIGGFTALREELIDDCALARRVKSAGGTTWLGLSHAVRSQRANHRLTDIWNMVTRAAFTQLKYSHTRLAACTLIMAIAFWAPAAALFHAGTIALAAITLAMMMLTFLPTLRFYNRSPAWTLALPLIGTLYLAMTWGSAVRHWRGRGAAWKGRIYKERSHDL